jgi:hypothetical protein
MKRIFSVIIFVIILIPVIPLRGQQIIKNYNVNGVCYAGNKVKKIYIPPPDVFYQKNGTKSGASVTINYTGFPSTAIVAMERARSILETMLPADTKFTILASWEKITTSGVLGNSSITGYVGGWGIDALNPRALYPVGLAEKIAGKSLNSDAEGDMILRINNSINWYLGIDGQTPLNQYDLITVVLHEICHGLGFFDSMNTNSSTGWYGISSIPMIYDSFIENFEGKRLTDTLSFLNYSAALRSQFTGGQLYLSGPLLKNYSIVNHYPASRARLWAPSIWDAGSSISHLDENVTPEINSLMTPYIDFGEAIHDPGKFTFSILGDLGWINTRIIPSPLFDTERHLTEIGISARIKSDTLYNRNKVGIVYSYNNFLSSDTVFMLSPNSDDNFNAVVNIPSYDTELQYYFFAEDCFFRMYRSPSLIDSIRYKVYIGTDTIKPVIIHTSPKYLLESIDTLRIEAAVTDNLGIDSVYLEYIINEGIPQYIGLQVGKNNSYSTLINTRLLNINGGDSIRYRIFAADSAGVQNISVLPKSGYFTVNIESVLPVIERYSTDFSGTASSDFFNIGFSVKKPAGFTKYGLNTKHPYESPGQNNMSIEYTAMLRHPLKFNESGIIISFRELVLVEPGEPGSLFGSPDFYDYVIVEGSKDLGLTWFNLTDGYDSRYVKSWETAYNSLIVDDNSKFVGKESMLLKHTVFYRPSDKISAGDTLMVRFRLYSDPFANGWGWVIEDLSINSLVDALDDTGYEAVNIYPNPGTGIIRLVFDKSSGLISKPVNYSIFNPAGVCIKNDQTTADAETFIDISGYSAGMYYIVVYLDDGIRTMKYILLK